MWGTRVKNVKYCFDAIVTYFVLYFHLDIIQLKYAMSILFVLKMSVCFFFQEGRKIWTKLHEIPPPSPLSLSVSKQPRISILQHCACVFYVIGLSRMCLKPCFPTCGKKHHRHISSQKKSRQISVDSEQLGKLLRNCHMGPACMDLSIRKNKFPLIGVWWWVVCY